MSRTHKGNESSIRKHLRGRCPTLMKRAWQRHCGIAWTFRIIRSCMICYESGEEVVVIPPRVREKEKPQTQSEEEEQKEGVLAGVE